MSLREPFVLLVIVAAALVPGSLLVARDGKRLREDPVEFLFMSLSLGLLALGWLALTLAELGRFSLGLLAALWGVVTLGAAWAWRSGLHTKFNLRGLLRFGRRDPIAETGPIRWEFLALGAWLIAASWLFFRPHEFVIGGADAGVYVSVGANIARSGGIRISDPILAGLDPALYPALLRALPATESAPYYILPGFYVTGAAHPGEIIPQFYPLHPVWFAVASALGGVRAELLMTPLWGLLGCLAVYMTGRRLWGWKIGFIALAGLSATALQIWFARYPTAEALTQYLLWTGIWASTAWLSGQRPARLWALVGGLAFGEVFLTRLDTYVLLIVPISLALWVWRVRAQRAAGIWFLAPCLLLAVQSLLHGLVLSRPYFLIQVTAGSAMANRGPALILGVVAALAALAALIALSAGNERVRRGTGVILSILPLVAAGGLVALAIYSYWLRPQIELAKLYPDWYAGSRVPNLDRENLVRLGWYLSPLGILLGVAGACWMLIKDANRRTALLLGIGIFFSLLFLWRIGANPHQIYAMRRYVPQVLPFFILCAAYLIGWLHNQFGGAEPTGAVERRPSTSSGTGGVHPLPDAKHACGWPSG